jgi:uncharacterized protein (TIGR03086 family)
MRAPATQDGVVDVATLFRRTVAVWQRTLAGVEASQWSDPTPCTEWDVHALVNHVVGEECWVGPLLAGRTIAEVGSRFDGDVLGDDPVGRGEDLARASVIAVDEAMLERLRVHLSYGDEDASEYLLQLAADHLIHGWDLASATGQDRAMEPDLLEEVAEWFAGREEMYRSGGAIGPRATMTGDPQVDLLAAFGRDAFWHAPTAHLSETK